MEQFFFDTSYFLALVDNSDVFHSRATSLMAQIQNPSSQLQTQIFLSDVVLNETWSVICRRIESKKCPERFGVISQTLKSKVTDTPILCLYEMLNINNYKRIIDLMTEHQGRLGFHDALIALFLSQVPDVTLVTFDRDFAAIPNLRVLS